jgi:predicted amidohydrolase
MIDDTLRIAVAQFRSTPCDVEANVRAVAAIVTDAADRGAKLVAFPELALTGYEPARLVDAPRAWLEEDDARLAPLARLCAARSTCVVLGAPLRTRDGARRIAAPIVTTTGAIVVSQKERVHASEAAYFTAGTSAAPVDVHGWRVSVGICFDVADPKHAERAARDGADVYIASSLYWQGEERRSDLHLGARAMDNRIFTALANHAGTTGGYASCGGSGVWSPTGDVVARVAGADEHVIFADLRRDALRAHRAA